MRSIAYLLLQLQILAFALACKPVANDSDLEAISGRDSDGKKKAFGILPVGAIGTHNPDRTVDFALIQCTGVGSGNDAETVIHRLEVLAASNLLSVNNGAICIPRKFGTPNLAEKVDSCGHQNFMEIKACEFARQSTPYGYPKIQAAANRFSRVTGQQVKNISKDIVRDFVTAQAIYLSMRGPTIDGQNWGQSLFLHTYARMSGVRGEVLLQAQDAQDFIFNPCDKRKFKDLSPATQQKVKSSLSDKLISSNLKEAAFHCSPQANDRKIKHYGVGGKNSNINQNLLDGLKSYSDILNLVHAQLLGGGSPKALGLADTIITEVPEGGALNILPTSVVMADNQTGQQTAFIKKSNTLQTNYNPEQVFEFKGVTGNVSNYTSSNGAQIQVAGQGNANQVDSAIVQHKNSQGFYAQEGSNFGFKIEPKGTGEDKSTHVWSYYVPGADGKPVNAFAGKSFYSTIEETANGVQRAIPARYHAEAVNLIGQHAANSSDPEKALAGLQYFGRNDLARNADGTGTDNSIRQAIYNNPTMQKFTEQVQRSNAAPGIPEIPGTKPTAAESTTQNTPFTRLSNFNFDPNTLNRFSTLNQTASQNGAAQAPNNFRTYQDGQLPVNMNALPTSNKLVLGYVDNVAKEFDRDYSKKVDLSTLSAEEYAKQKAQIDRKFEVHAARDAGILYLANQAMTVGRTVDSYSLGEDFRTAMGTSEKKLRDLRDDGVLNQTQYEAELKAVNSQFQNIMTQMQADRNYYNSNTQKYPERHDFFANPQPFDAGVQPLVPHVEPQPRNP